MNNPRLVMTILIGVILTLVLGIVNSCLDDTMPANNPELANITLATNDSTGFSIVQVHRVELFMLRTIMYDSTGAEVLDLVDDWNGKKYIGTVKDSDSTRIAIPPEEVPRIWEAIRQSYERGKPFEYVP